MEKASYFKIGLFIIVGTIIAVIGIVALGVGTIFEKKVWIETYVDESVQGLDIGSAVKFRGVSVGKVEQISLTSAEYNTQRRYIMLRIGLTSQMFQFPLADAGGPAFKSEVDKGLRVRLASAGLTGGAYIEADYQDPARNPPLEIDWQPRYPYIPSARSKITQLADSMDRILSNIEKIDAARLVEGVEKSLATITKVAEGANFDALGKQANAFLAEIRDSNRQFRDLIASGDIKSAVADAAAAAKSTREIMSGAEKPIKQVLADLPQASEKISELMKRLDTISADLPDSSNQLQQTLRRLNRLLAGQQQEIRTTLDNLRVITENLKELSEDSKKYPSQVIFGAPPPPSGVMSR
ncbi:MAG: MCE family protein [Deltaproteobacteria bacterium]|nr:MCE family protein [Deltaproteobacteria bacterium]